MACRLAAHASRSSSNVLEGRSAVPWTSAHDGASHTVRTRSECTLDGMGDGDVIGVSILPRGSDDDVVGRRDLCERGGDGGDVFGAALVGLAQPVHGDIRDTEAVERLGPLVEPQFAQRRLA